MGDVIKSDLPYFDVCIANMPYQVCVRLLDIVILIDIRSLLLLSLNFYCTVHFSGQQGLFVLSVSSYRH